MDASFGGRTCVDGQPGGVDGMPALRKGEGDDQNSEASALVGIDGEQVSKKQEEPACLAGDDNQTAPLRAVAGRISSAGSSRDGGEAWTYAVHPMIGTMQI